MALHACTNFESTPWDELSGCQLGKLYRATGSVIRVVNARRCTRAPNDTDSEEVIRALNAELDKAGEDYDKAWRHDLNDKNNYQVLVAEVARLRANAGRYQFIADNACDVSFYVANTDSGDGDTAPGPRVELTRDQYPLEMFGTGKAKLDFAVDALMATKDVATQSTDTENVSRHEGGQT